MSCPKCAKHRVIAIAVNIGEHKVTMQSCSNCGERWWEQEGRTVALPNVLALAADRR